MWGSSPLEARSRVRNSSRLWQSIDQHKDMRYGRLNIGQCRVGLVSGRCRKLTAAAVIGGCWITFAAAMICRGCWHGLIRAQPATNG